MKKCAFCERDEADIFENYLVQTDRTESNFIPIGPVNDSVSDL